MENIVSVDPKLLSPEAYEAVVDDFVLREGTDYGHNEWTLQQKREVIQRQLEAGKRRLVYDHGSQTCNILSSEDLHFSEH